MDSCSLAFFPFCVIDLVKFGLFVDINLQGKMKTMLSAISILLFVGIIVESAFFYNYYLKTTRSANDRNLPPESNGQAKKPGSVSKGCEYRVAIEILDPISVAKRESKLARIVTDLAPNLITKEVYKRVQKEVNESMNQRGIESKVTVITI